MDKTREAICSSVHLSSGRKVLIHGKMGNNGYIQVTIRTQDYSITADIHKLIKYALKPQSKKQTRSIPVELLGDDDFDI